MLAACTAMRCSAQACDSFSQAVTAGSTVCVPRAVHALVLTRCPSVLCSGGAKGIGYACAACLGHEGAQVVIADIDETAAQQAAQRLQLEGVAASAFRCDVGTKEEVRASQYPESPLTRPELP